MTDCSPSDKADDFHTIAVTQSPAFELLPVHYLKVHFDSYPIRPDGEFAQQVGHRLPGIHLPHLTVYPDFNVFIRHGPSRNPR